jgi:hypothetical protein
VNRPVVIAAFLAASEAQEARTLLEAAAIEGAVVPRDGELPRRCADAFDGGWDVVVDDSQSDEALALLHRAWPAAEELPSVETCPACGSRRIFILPRLLLFAAASALLLTFGSLTGERDLFFLVIAIVGGLLLLTPGRRCRDCGERWRWKAPLGEADAAELPELLCPRCASEDTFPLRHRRERAITLIVNLIIPPFLVVWPFQKRWRCRSCGHEWR